MGGINMGTAEVLLSTDSKTRVQYGEQFAGSSMYFDNLCIHFDIFCIYNIHDTYNIYIYIYIYTYIHVQDKYMLNTYTCSRYIHVENVYSPYTTNIYPKSTLLCNKIPTYGFVPIYGLKVD